MNAKKCKALRRLAERNTVGKPARRLIGIGQRTRDGRRADCAVNDPESTRGEYRALKKIAHTIKFTKQEKP